VTIRAPVIAGNWKLNLGPSAATAFVADLLPRLPADGRATIALFPPAISFAAARQALRLRPDVLLGVQNIFWEASGAFTGEISAPLAVDAGASLTLVGHSERRHIFGETDDEVRRKVVAALDAGLIPVLCVGETLAEREAGDAAEIVRRQLGAVLDALQGPDITRILIAYEPVWAIGTGRTATPNDASEMHRTIRSLIIDRIPSDRVVPILYGGSVKPDNARDLLAATDVDGLLIGGASLDAAGFAKICTLSA
jgi:triosephosphate isomerase (TIM)